MIISKSYLPLLKEAFQLLQSCDFDGFHRLLEKKINESVIAKSKKYLTSSAVLCMLAAEEYFYAQEYDLALNKTNQAQKLDNHYLYLLFQAVLYQQIGEQEHKIIPLYDELIVRDNERNELPEVLRLFIINNLATSWYKVETSPEWHKKKYGKNVILDYAEQYYLELLKASKQIESDYTFLMVNALNGLGNIEAKKNNIEKAIPYFEAALESNPPTSSLSLQKNYPDLLVNSLNGLAWCQFQKEEYYNASTLYTKANRTAISALGEEHEVSVKLAHNLALAWEERMGLEIHGFNQVGQLNKGKKNTKGRLLTSKPILSQPSYNQKSISLNPVKNASEKKVELFIDEAISQKNFPITWVVPSVSKVLLNESSHTVL